MGRKYWQRLKTHKGKVKTKNGTKQRWVKEWKQNTKKIQKALEGWKMDKNEKEID